MSVSFLHCETIKNPPHVSVTQRRRLLSKDDDDQGGFGKSRGASQQPGGQVWPKHPFKVLSKNTPILTCCFCVKARMHKDGRQPQTFRLTIRRHSTANKWSSRESRQAPIPHHVSQKITSGNLAMLFQCLSTFNDPPVQVLWLNFLIFLVMNVF